MNFSNQAIGALVVRSMDVALMAQIMQQQRIAGAKMIEMIHGNPVSPRRSDAQPQPESPVAPARGAAEPGKGSLVDIVA